MKYKDYKDIPTIPGMQSPTEIIETIKQIGANIAKDQSSKLFNYKKIESMRACIDLFEQYNGQLKAQGEWE